MNNAIVLALLGIPNVLVRYAYPRFLRSFIVAVQVNFNLTNAQMRQIGSDLVLLPSVADLPTTQPITSEQDILIALREIVTVVLTEMNVGADVAEADDFLAAIGARIAKDQQFADAA